MHFELITFKLLISVDGSVQVGDVDVRIRNESCATIQQRVNTVSVCDYGLSNLLLHDWRCRNNLLLELVHEKLLQVDGLRHLRNLERIEDLLDVGRDKLLVSFDLRARITIKFRKIYNLRWRHIEPARFNDDVILSRLKQCKIGDVKQ